MRIGLIGAGRIGTFHATTLSRHREVGGSLIVTDADPVRAQRLADRLGATAAPSVNEIFTWGVDAVVITAATSAHAELIGRAARSGLPVFCEKPIAVDLPGTLSALAEVDAAERFFRWASSAASTWATPLPVRPCGRAGSAGCTPSAR